MARKLTLVKGAPPRGVLVYGMRMFENSAVSAVEPARVMITGSEPAGVTMHVIEGTRVQIRRQLMRSIDAFFELLEEE